MSIETQSMTIVVDDITSITITTVQQDTDTKYVREVRVFGTPAVEGQPAPEEFVIRLKAVDQNSLALTAPSSVF